MHRRITSITPASSAMTATKCNKTTASLRTYPSALASSVLQCPSSASMPALLKMRDVRAFSMIFTPQHSTLLHSFVSTTSRLRCAPTSEDEHAVSTLRHTPCRLNVNDILPHATLSALPVACVTPGASVRDA